MNLRCLLIASTKFSEWGEKRKIKRAQIIIIITEICLIRIKYLIGKRNIQGHK